MLVLDISFQFIFALQEAYCTANLFRSLLSIRVSLSSRCPKRLVSTCLSKNWFHMAFRKLMYFGNFRPSYSKRKKQVRK